MSGAKLNKLKSGMDLEKKHQLKDALNLLEPAAKFDESVDVVIALGIDPKQSDQNVRGSCELPNGTGKDVKVAVFAEGDAASAALAAGADFVGMDDLGEKISKSEISVDIVVASPDSMKVVGKYGRVLGPKGLMPNPKDGTVANDVALATKSAKSGKIKFKSEKGGLIHCSIGKLSFSKEHLAENIEFLVSTLSKLKPASAKGKFLKRCFVSTTMGPGIEVELD